MPPLSHQELAERRLQLVTVTTVTGKTLSPLAEILIHNYQSFLMAHGTFVGSL